MLAFILIPNFYSLGFCFLLLPDIDNLHYTNGISGYCLHGGILDHHMPSRRLCGWWYSITILILDFVLGFCFVLRLFVCFTFFTLTFSGNIFNIFILCICKFGLHFSVCALHVCLVPVEARSGH